MNDVSFLELVSRYCADRHIRPSTVASYHTSVRAIQRYIGTIAKPSMVTRDMILEWRRVVLRSNDNPNGIVEVSWNNYVRHLSSLFNYGIKHRLIMGMVNPFEKVRAREPRKPKKIVKPRTIRYAREVIAVCRDFEAGYGKPSQLHPAWFWEVVVETFYYTGIRLNQLLHVRAGDVQLKKMVIHRSYEGSKTHSESVIPIAEGLYPHLCQLLVSAQRASFRREDQLFNVNRFSNRHRRLEMDVNQVEHFFKRLSNFCGEKISPHRYRHTLGTELMEEPERNIKLTQMILDHASIHTTMEYVHPSVDSMRRVLNQRQDV